MARAESRGGTTITTIHDWLRAWQCVLAIRPTATILRVFRLVPGHQWCGVVWCGVVWCGVVWCGVVWRGVVWCGVVWCDVVCRRRCYQRAKGRDVYPRVKVNGLGCVCCVRAVCKCVVA